MGELLMNKILMVGSIMSLAMLAFAAAHMEMEDAGFWQQERAAQLVFDGKCNRGEVHCIKRDEGCVQMVLEGVPKCYKAPPKGLEQGELR